VPLITLLGSIGGWRGALGTHGVVTLLCTLLVWWVVPRDVTVHHESHRTKVPLHSLLQPKLLSFLGAGMTERICFAFVAMFIATYLQRSYGVEFHELALVLAVIALGTLLGNVLGGRIADSTRARALVFAQTSVATALIALPTFLWQPGLGWSVAMGFTYSLVNALGRPSLLATLSEFPNEIRGPLFGIQIATASMGWLLAASVGAVLIAQSQFAGLGLCASVLALLGAGLAWFSSSYGHGKKARKA
jgi:MFS transporter, DHA1 family, inner membrane transport protein